MSLNFACARLHTEICCDTVTVDGFEAANLIADGNGHRRDIGFLAEGFVKPPVSITLSLPCAVKLDSIVVDGKVGSQRSVQFEVYTACSSGRKTNGTAVAFDATDGRIFSCIGRARCTEKSSVVRFARTHCLDAVSSTCSSSSRLNALSSSDDFICAAQLSNRSMAHLDRISAVVLRVTGTVNGSAVAVRWVEVWAQPVVDTPIDIIHRLYRFYPQEQESDVHCLSFFGDNSSQNASSSNDNGGVFLPVQTTIDKMPAPLNDSVAIPDEFQDAITHELMVLPVLLPSGMTVDQTTLDRHIAGRASWGAAPSDPFTGRTFTAGYKPVAHSSLKARLDQFMMCNAERLGGGVARTLGGASVVAMYPAHVEPISRNVIINDAAAADVGDRLSIKRARELPEWTKFHTDIVRHTTVVASDQVAISSVQPFNKKMKISDGTMSVTAGYHHLAVRLPISTSKSTARATTKPISKSHPLNCSLTVQSGCQTSSNSVLLSLAEKSSASDVVTSVYLRSEVTCDHCNDRLTYLYQLGCSHLLCRPCLLEATTDAAATVKQSSGTGSGHCLVCNMPFSSSEPVRVNCLNRNCTSTGFLHA